MRLLRFLIMDNDCIWKAGETLYVFENKKKKEHRESQIPMHSWLQALTLLFKEYFFVNLTFKMVRIILEQNFFLTAMHHFWDGWEI